MNIFLINHYAGSPTMGMEYRPYYLAKEWIKMGHYVTILVANNSHIRLHNTELNTDIKEEFVDEIRYIWIKTPQYNGNGIKRVKNMFAFVKKALSKASYFAKTYKPDVVIASSTYPSDNYVAKKIAKLSGASYIYEVHDLWPLSPMELGGMSKFHPFIIAMQHAENFAYKNADAVVSMLPKTQEHMKTHGFDLKKWYYIPNGVILDEWENKKSLNTQTKEEINNIKQRYNTVIGYTGTFGVANALESFILSAEISKNIGFIIIGKGPEKDNLIKLTKENNIDNVFILGVINKQEIPELLNLFDFLYIGLQYKSLFRFGISPNKLIDYMMAGKPIIQAINAGNDIVKEANAGISIEPENPQAIADAILKLQNTPKKDLEMMGKNGRNFVLKHHNYKILAKKFIDIITKL